MSEVVTLRELNFLIKLGAITEIEIEDRGTPGDFRLWVITTGNVSRLVVHTTDRTRPRIWKNSGNIVALLEHKGITLQRETLRLGNGVKQPIKLSRYAMPIQNATVRAEVRK